tara:strand:- start:911 stop:1453 length:543 start_codon:yes stop_codon:yes gene_type:complete
MDKLLKLDVISDDYINKCYDYKYVEMSDKRFDDIHKRVIESYPNSCICYILEIFNNTLLRKYNNNKEKIMKRDGNIECKQLFHGTNEKSIKSICNSGFLTKYNKTSAFGKGSYFALNAMYSYSYMPTNSDGLSFMFLADVLIGKVGEEIYTNSTTPTSIYVTPKDYYAYPRYVIAFYKNA